MLRFQTASTLFSAIIILLISLTGCKKDMTSKHSFAVETEGVPESLQFLIRKKGFLSSAANKNLNFTCANSISYSLTTFTSDMSNRKPNQSGLRFDPIVFETGPASTIDEFRFGRNNTMPYASNDVATAIVSELEKRDVFPWCKPSEKGREINITFIEAFHLEEPANFLPKHVKVIGGKKGVIQIAIVLGYRQLIRDYVEARTVNFKTTNHRFVAREFFKWAYYYDNVRKGVPRDVNGELISSETALNNIPPDIVEFFRNMPPARLSYSSNANWAFQKLQDRSVPVYVELMTGLIQACLNQVCSEEGEYRLRDRVSEENFQEYIQKLSRR